MLNQSAYATGQQVKGKASLREGATKPPRPFEEGDLVNIMDDIGRYANIGREDMAVLREKNQAGSGKAGIGTSRTRGDIIKKTFESGFLEKYKEKKKVYIRPTSKAIKTVDILGSMPTARVLVSPELTAQWEVGLKKIEEGVVSPRQFMDKITAMITVAVKEIQDSGSRASPGKRNVSHPKHGASCEKCSDGKLEARSVTKKDSKRFGQVFVKCNACDYFGEFIDP